MKMKCLFALLLTFVFSNTVSAQDNRVTSIKNIPKILSGNFKDDYDLTYTINDSMWIQESGMAYHLIKYDSTGNYFVAKNNYAFSGNQEQFIRIDIMYFKNMEPWFWGFCYTAYQAKTFEEAEATISADRNNPKKGCGGFPFSRMKKE